MGRETPEMKPLLIFSVLLLTVVTVIPAHAETPFSLSRSGYSLIYEGYAVVKTCAPSEPIVVGPYIVICNSYSYPYHYGNVFLFARSVVYEGRNLIYGFLCLDEEDECESVQSISRK